MVKKPTMSVVVAILFLELLLATAVINISFDNGGSSIGCTESERQALLRFRQDLVDPSDRLASWTADGKCCTWVGVVCDNMTGHVHELHLRNPFRDPFGGDVSDAEYDAYMRSALDGKLNPSLLDLKHLIYLDLSGNSFEGHQIPRFLGSMGNLRYLNLSGTGFVGMIPHKLGNLSNLQYLSLGRNYWDRLYVDNFHWLSGLSSLNHLDLSTVDLCRVSHWLLVANTIPSLVALELSGCDLHHFPPLSVVNFSSLAILDLSNNEFVNTLIPNWLFGLSDLVFLDLHLNNFRGPIPGGLQNLTSLRHLDLSDNHFSSSIPNWLSRLACLESLSLSYNNLQDRISVAALGNFTSIRSLDLSFNRLEGKIPRSFGGFCNLRSFIFSKVKLCQQISEILDIFSGCVSKRLESLDLSSAQLSGLLTNQIGQFKNLRNLLLEDNSISGPIPSSFGEIFHLKSLDLSHNKLNGSIPASLGKLSSLRDLILSYNELSDPIPTSLGRLSSLRILDLSYNKLNGTLSEIHFANLTRLTFLDASKNSLMFKVDSHWIPPFQLEKLYSSSCDLGPKFPPWLHSQRSIFFLDISHSGISDTIPRNWFKEFPSQFFYLNLSHNQLYGEITNLIEATQLESLDLSWNNLSGLLPLVPSNMYELDLSHNALSGSIFHFLCYGMNESKGMQILNLGENFLLGHVPDCWMNWQYLSILNLVDNKFCGALPGSMGALTSLQSLHLSKNSLSGTIPESFKNFTKLVALDIGENEFVGNIPTWVGERFSRMMILRLRSNMFCGLLPLELCHLTSLQILDLAYNNLSGSIPRCIKNFSAMVTMSSSVGNEIQYAFNFSLPIEGASLVMKGKSMEYDTILKLVRSIDLSKNNFSGEIPIEVTNLKALQSLNLSHNLLTGRIPKSIGVMRSLESIDLSENQLSGEIPQSISNLTFLSHLNLSNNNLIGKIPLGTQLQGFDASCFTGNELCGSPLPKNCPAMVPGPNFENAGREDDDKHEVNWFYVGMAPGTCGGFLVCNRSVTYQQEIKIQILRFLGSPWIQILRCCKAVLVDSLKLGAHLLS